MSSEAEASVLAGFRAAQEALHRGDFEAAFAGVADDVEWQLGDWVFDGGTLHGREALIAFFVRMQDAGDWRVRAEEVQDLGDGRMLLRSRGRLMGRTTGISDEMDIFQLVDFGRAGVERVREFRTLDEALAAARDAPSGS